MKRTLQGPCGYRVELDTDKVIPDDPGADTPALIYDRWGNVGTYWCAWDTGYVEERFISAKAVHEWLDEINEEVNAFLYPEETGNV